MAYFVETYLAKQCFRSEIKDEPEPSLNICVVIPCYNESGLLRSLQSLWDCLRPAMAVEVIVVINSPENSAVEILKKNLDTFYEALAWIMDHSDPKLRFHLIQKSDLPRKFAGVGLARKIGMDEATCRLALVNQIKGIIAGFDADAVCDPNYLVEMEKHFQKNKKSSGASVYFEHPVSGNEYESDMYDGIVLYELHLRYLNQALRYTNHPHAYHTVGSSFAVRMEEYVKQGGMNRRLAGEDFYFLQKIIALGNFTEINTTRIIPSPRESGRVPFGTGASMKRWMTERSMKTYNLAAFEDICMFIGCVNQLYDGGPERLNTILQSLSPPLNEFLQVNNVQSEVLSILSNSASFRTFQSRFFRWFNAFRVIKYLNFSHENYYEKIDVTIEAERLIEKLEFRVKPKEPNELLTFYRELDRTGFGLIQQ